MKRPVLDIYRTGQKIKQIMQKKGITVKEVQQYLGLETPQSIYHWFSGRNMPTVDNLYALSELLSVPVDTMLSGNRKQDFYCDNGLSKIHLYVYYNEIMELMAG